MTEFSIEALDALVAMGTGTFMSSRPWTSDHEEDPPGSSYSRGVVRGGENGEYVIADVELPPMADLIAAAPSLASQLREALKREQRLRQALTEIVDRDELLGTAHSPEEAHEDGEAFIRALSAARAALAEGEPT